MRRTLGAALIGLALLTLPSPSRAQVGIGPWTTTSTVDTTFFGAPGSYGVAYGFSSFGVPRTYTEFSSPYGGGYGYGYAPSSILPGRYGVGLWRPGYSVPGYAYGASTYAYYRTFPYPLRPYAPPAPLGLYAPAFGPPVYGGW